jgi:glycosyltransferase involved in cell wall biosynthesis
VETARANAEPPLSIAIVAASPRIVGGQSAQATALVNALRGDGHRVTFVPIDPTLPGAIARVPYLRTVMTQLLYWPSLFRACRADVVHVFSASYWSFLLAPVPAMLLARACGRRAVLHYHSGEAPDHLARWGWLVHPWLRLAHEIVVPSVFLRDVFARHGYRATVIANVMNLEAFSFRERQTLQPRLLSVRSLEKPYRVDAVIEAFAIVKQQFPDATLVVAGAGSQDAALRRLVDQRGLKDVKFVGALGPAAMAELYDDADIFVNVPEIDNQPLSVLEAMASGVAVVSTAVGDVPNMIEDRRTGRLVAHSDPAAVAAVVAELLTQSDASAMCRQARQSVRRHDWARVRHAWRRVYAPNEREGKSAGRLDRLRRMESEEIVGRTRQELMKLKDRASLAAPRGVMSKRAVAPMPSARVSSRTFFADTGGAQMVSALKARFPGECADIVSKADRIMEGRFDLLGYRDLQFGTPIDWNLDPVAGRRAPNAHWSAIDPLDPDTVGDSKVVWELSRHQWAVNLAEASRLTGDAAYLDRATELIGDWLRANPPGVGINWSSSLEVALRLISWSWVLALADGGDQLPSAFRTELSEAISTHAQHVERYLSYYFSPNTHLTGEALGLFYAGLLFPSLPGAARWRDLGRQILVDEVNRQVSEDGVSTEQASCYHRYTAEIYLHFLLLARRNGIELPADVPARIERMFEFLTAISEPAGRMPSFGDADGGWLMPLIARDADDCRGVLSVGALAFSRPEFAAAAGGPTPESLWFFGADALSRFDRLTLASPPSSSRAFERGGFVVMRGAAPASPSLILHTGSLGKDLTGAHAHADLLSINCAAYGESFVVDPGSYCYVRGSKWRDYFRGTAAHSTVTIDGAGQAEPAGLFAWRSRPRAVLRAWESDARTEFADAHHDAYGRLSDPVRHRRRVLFVKPRYWVVVDDLIGNSAHRFDVRFQFAPKPVVCDADQWCCAWGERGAGLWLKSFADAALNVAVRTGEEDPMCGWVSSDYGQRTPAPMVVVSGQGVLPLRIVTLMHPVAHIDNAPEVTALRSADGEITGLRWRDTGETVVIDDDIVTVMRNERVQTCAELPVSSLSIQ